MHPLFLIFIAAADFLIGIYVLIKKPSAAVNRSFFVFVMGIALWVSGFALLFIYKIFLFDKFIHYGGLLMVFGLFMFAKVFPDGKNFGRRFWLACLPLLAVAVFVIPFNLLIKNMIIDTDGKLEPVNGPLLPYYIAVAGIYIIFSLISLGRHYLRSSGVFRNQMQYLFTGVGSFIAAALIFDGILPSFGISNLNFIGPLFSIVFISLTAYAIVRHQLLDIRIIIKRGLIYFLLLAAMTVTYWIAIFLIGHIIPSNTLLTILMAASVTAAFGIFSLGIVEKYFRLEERIKERTAEIQKLQEGQKQMMIDISHGLQTPLTVIKGKLDLLKKKLGDNKEAGVLEKSVDGISKFIYDLLDLARLETTQEDFKKAPVNFSEILANLVEYFKVLAKDKNIEVISTIQPEIRILGKKDKLEELVTNLVSNAVKYINSGGERKIFIDLREKSNEVSLSVKDTGIGIAKEDLPNIFKRFYRAKNNDHEIQGTGLGLAIVKKIVEKHNGIAEVESELGKGTQFTIKFKKMISLK